MLNIVVPMAGRGSRFSKEGYLKPKPLIDILGKPMIEWVIKNITPQEPHKFIFIVQEEHCKEFKIDEVLASIAPSSEIVQIDGVTEGALCTVLKAEYFLQNNGPLMIANSDQFIDFDINQYLNFQKSNLLDGLIMTMKANDPKWSFVALEEGTVTKVVEKEVISDEATVGIYNFSNSSQFLKSAKKMIEKNLKVNGEFYVAPAYNELIKDGGKIGFYNIGSEHKGMYGLGIPSDLKKFLELDISKKYFDIFFC